MKRMMIFGFAVVMAIVLSIPAVYAQQQGTQTPQTAQDGNWRCPRWTQSADGKWICPAAQSGTPGGGYGRMRGQRGMRGGMRGQCWRNNTQAQPPAQPPAQAPVQQ